MKNRKIISYTLIVISMLLFALAGYRVVQIDKKVKGLSNMTAINIYIEEFDISKTLLEQLDEKLIEIENIIIENKISLKINEKEYKYTLKDMGIKINKDKLKNEIIKYHENIDYYDLYNSISKNEFDTKIFEYEYEFDDELLNNFVVKLSKKVNIIPEKGILVMTSDRNLLYKDEVIGFTLDEKESLKIIKNNFKNKEYSENIELKGKTEYINDPLKTINKKISSFSTTFDNTVSRKYNLEAGAMYIDGVIVNPNENFSFYQNAGPFNKKGYTSYQGVIGNGVCQVATTLYNAQLLAGLKTVTRYNHGKKSTYVEGGLDATVAASKTFITDYKFQNNYNYPIYISAYVNGGTITVDIWSNELATNGITYKTESIKIGNLSYSAYRYGYKDGKEVSREHLGNSYYYQ